MSSAIPAFPARYTVAGIGMEFESQVGESFRFELRKPFDLFRSPTHEPELRFLITSRDTIHSKGDRVYESGLNWRIRHLPEGPIYESYHPPSGRALATAAVREDFRMYDVVFSEATLIWLWQLSASPIPRPLTVDLPYPLDQILLLPALARAEAFLVHACGAVLDGKALVFAGHSGDGKTTLARILAAEGLELLSDERIAIRKQNGSFWAHGTPWPGEGHVVSPAAYPLGAVFLLRKSKRHRLTRQPVSTLAAEIFSRSIVPYYFPEETGQILELHRQLAGSVPLYSLEFSLSPDLAPILSRAL